MKTITHQPFLEEVVGYLNRSHRPNTALVIVPNQLSMEYCGFVCHKAKWQAGCTTLHQLMRSHSKLTLLSTWALLRRLYASVGPISQEPFEQFARWGRILLEDFNAIDSYLIDGVALFESLYKQRTREARCHQGPLDAFKKVRSLPLWKEKESMGFWEQLPLLYASFREGLIREGKGYEGLCYSMAQPLPEIRNQALVFVGFNRLMPVEAEFIKQCQAMASTAFFWDTDPHYLDNLVNIAGHYLRQHREKKWFQSGFSPATYFNDPGKKVFLTEVPTSVAQVQAVVAALAEKTDEGKPRFLPSQTAIVVSGSDLLIPLFDQLADRSIPLHCRVSYPFHATVIYCIVERLVQLWESFVAGQEAIYTHMAAVWVLWDPFAAETAQGAAMRPPLDGRMLRSLFDPWLHQEGLLAYLQAGLTYMYGHFIETDRLFWVVNKTALRHLLSYIEGLIAEMADCSIAFFLHGLKSSNMPFHIDHPATGLYIIDVAESYNLDFENVFFLGMNEGCFPKRTHQDSFLPYDLCYSFGLPLADKVAEQQTAYGFYRLLQRAQNIYGYYVQKNHLDAAGEISRLWTQLTFDSQLNIITAHHSLQLLDRPIAPIVIQKSDAVMQLLNRFLAASSRLTPAALIAYLSCPLQFYFRYVLQLKQKAKGDSEMVQLGTLFHDVMARLYQPFVDMQVDTSRVMQLKGQVHSKIEEAMAASHTPIGAPLLLRALLEKLVTAMLDLDGAEAPFTLLGVEVAMQQSMALDGERKVWLGGVVDRIDRRHHVIRMIDYKTGLSNGKVGPIASLFDPTKIQKNKAIFQLFFYAWLFHSLHGADLHQSIMPYLIHIRELFLKDYTPGIFQSDHGTHYHRIEDMQAYLQPFETGLKALLLELFNPVLPFVQTADLTICAYCPYVRICQRD
ncbi:PD-(D/E)XK nuclease family protein [Cardinium endosymbiont of Sogatella furcifera]|uniref:PD-(D/E)XK nuclease family protein n=1 Tax=Cardinium endosymbiont of Sogatella furcifera TaxID=650378 RepID=UPI0013B41542|nr:PD-(D/E)XK nuclease family protein [Cardinium endosymbiont of Sogatella furcifera]